MHTCMHTCRPPAAVRTPWREQKHFLSLNLFLLIHSPPQNQLWTVHWFLTAFLRAGTVVTLSTPKR